LACFAGGFPTTLLDIVSNLLVVKLEELAKDFGDDVKLIPHELLDKIPQEVLAEAKKVGLDVFELGFRDLIKKITTWAYDHIDLIFEILRRVRPVLVFRGFGLVTRYQDCVDALAADDVFGTTNDQQLRDVAGNPFLLGMANTAEYERDHTNLRLAIRRSDLPGRVVPFVGAGATNAVAGGKGRLEIVTGLTRAVTAAWVGDYFGVPGPTPGILTDWSIKIFNYLTIPPGTNPVGELEGIVAGKEFQAYLWLLIKARHLEPGKHDDVLERLVALQKANPGLPGLSDDLIKSNLVGMISGAIPPIATMAAIAIDQLLDRPDALSGAQAAARSGDDQLLGRYLNEAMRMRPIGPGVLRRTTADWVAGRGQWYQTTIPKGTTVMVATQSAMMDEALYASPKAFSIDRNEYNFLLFGSGQHACFGKYIVEALLPPLLRPLLRQENLRRAQGDAGQLQMNGVQAASLTLEYKAT
jgi:cytochrome P450